MDTRTMRDMLLDMERHFDLAQQHLDAAREHLAQGDFGDAEEHLANVLARTHDATVIAKQLKAAVHRGERR
jgi:hypothetical protein